MRGGPATPLVVAAITAGGRVDGAFAAAIGTAVKALAPLGDETLLDRAIDAARDAGANRIVVVGDDAVRARAARRVDTVIDASPAGHDNVRRAMSCGEPHESLLLVASDLPFVTSADLFAFVAAARATNAAIAMPLADANDYERAYPRAASHATRIGRERICNGSVVWFAPGAATRALEVAERFFLARKSRWRMAALLGPRLLARFVARSLTIDDIEARARRLGLDARAIRNASPALCYDVDTLADYRYALARV